MPAQIIRTDLPGFAASTEILVVDADESIRQPISLGELKADFAVVTLTLPGGQFPKTVTGRLEVETSNATYSGRKDDESSYSDETVIVTHLREESGFLVRFERNHEHYQMTAPVVINVLAFSADGSPGKQLSRGARIRCKGCKITAKALALAIVAAAALAATPAAVIAAVAAYLGVASVIAAAFIESVLDDTAEEIAEKLCARIGLCPRAEY